MDFLTFSIVIVYLIILMLIKLKRYFINVSPLQEEIKVFLKVINLELFLCFPTRFTSEMAPDNQYLDVIYQLACFEKQQTKTIK